MNSRIEKIIEESIATKQRMLEHVMTINSIGQAVVQLKNCILSGNRIYLCGNGGSAADAQHIAAELTGRFYKERNAWPAEALNCNTSHITAVANDYSFDVIYERIIKGIGKPGDVLIALSTSGNSKNIILAVEAARQLKMITIGLTGQSGGLMNDLCDCMIKVPSNDTPRIQESHILVGHILCQILEEELI